jgi:hypothetical protein
MKADMMGLLRQGLSSAQVMIHHKVHVKKMALKNEHVTRNTFVFSSNVRNLAKK